VIELLSVKHLVLAFIKPSYASALTTSYGAFFPLFPFMPWLLSGLAVYFNRIFDPERGALTGVCDRWRA
jgi:hypothetical protein